jgi:hypothetical protein
MAYINQKTGSSNFNVKIIRKGVVSFSTDEPEILHEEEEFTLKILTDVTSGEVVTFDELSHVSDEEIDSDGYWVNSKVSKLKNMTHDELVAYILQMEAGKSPVQTSQPIQQVVHQTAVLTNEDTFETLDLGQSEEEVLF